LPRLNNFRDNNSRRQVCTREAVLNQESVPQPIEARVQIVQVPSATAGRSDQDQEPYPELDHQPGILHGMYKTLLMSLDQPQILQ